MLKKMLNLLLLASVFGLVACNTMEGAGRDVEAAGETVQEKADENRPSNP
jgi:predicted small secreted protein